MVDPAQLNRFFGFNVSGVFSLIPVSTSEQFIWRSKIRLLDSQQSSWANTESTWAGCDTPWHQSGSCFVFSDIFLNLFICTFFWKSEILILYEVKLSVSLGLIWKCWAIRNILLLVRFLIQQFAFQKLFLEGQLFTWTHIDRLLANWGFILYIFFH